MSDEDQRREQTVREHLRLGDYGCVSKPAVHPPGVLSTVSCGVCNEREYALRLYLRSPSAVSWNGATNVLKKITDDGRIPAWLCETCGHLSNAHVFRDPNNPGQQRRRPPYVISCQALNEPGNGWSNPPVCICTDIQPRPWETVDPTPNPG